MNQIKAGVILNYVIIFLNIAVGLLYTPYMLRTMGQSEYGLYSLVASVISYLTVLDLGFGNAIVRYTAKYRAEGKQTEQYEMFGMFLVLYTIIGIIAFIAGLGLYFNVDNLFGDTMTDYELDRARIMMMLLIVNLAITFPLSTFGSIVQAYEQFVFNRSLKIARTILSTVVMIGLLSMGYKAVAMVVVQTIFNITTLLIDYFYCRYRIKIKIFFRNFKWGFLKEVATYSFWIFLTILMDRIYWSTGQFILGAKVGTTAVAVFAIAVQLQQMYMNFSTAISGVFLPKVTGMVARDDNPNEISNLFIRTGRIQFIAICFILSGFIVFGRKFIHLWAGPEYNSAYIITLLFFLSMLPDLIQNLGIAIMQARNQTRFRAILGVGVAIVSIIFQLILCRYYGAIGCAIAIALLFFLGQGVIINIYYKIKQKLDIVAFWLEILKMSIAPIITSCCYYVCTKDIIYNSWGKLAFSIIIYSIIYILIFWLFSMNNDEKNMILSIIKKKMNN